jgi:hypothetical protein
MLCLVAVAATGPLLSTPPAVATENLSENCITVLKPLKAGQAQSEIADRACGEDAARLAEAGTLLMTWYSDANYKGVSDQIMGQYGPCDGAGYKIDNVNRFGRRLWRHILSSYTTHNNCYHSTAWTEPSFQGDSQWFEGNVPYVGDKLNDNVGSFITYSESSGLRKPARQTAG